MSALAAAGLVAHILLADEHKAREEFRSILDFPILIMQRLCSHGLHAAQ